jgi:hypothetical protein
MQTMQSIVDDSCIQIYNMLVSSYKSQIDQELYQHNRDQQESRVPQKKRKFHY